MSLALFFAISAAVVSGTLAIATAAQAGRSIARWSFALGLLLFGIQSLLYALAIDEMLLDRVVYWEALSLWIISLFPGVWLVFSVSYGRANHWEVLSKHRWWFVAVSVVPALLTALFRSQTIFASTPTVGEPGWQLRLGIVGLGLHALFLVSSIVILMNLEATFRASVGTIRWRIKFVVLGLAVLFVVRAYSSTEALLFRAPDFSLRTVNSAGLLLASVLICRGLLRSGHFEVAVYPSTAVLFNSLTVIVAGAYLLVVGILAKVFTHLGAQSSFEVKALLILVLLVLLALLLSSDRVRFHTKRFLSRHFQRPAYDYRAVWRIFTNSTASRVESSSLCQSVARRISEIFDCLSVAIWLVDERGDKLVPCASTILVPAELGQLSMGPSQSSDLINQLKAHPDPVDLDSTSASWATALKDVHPDKFRKGGHRVCVSLMAAGQFLGTLVLGDRIAGLPFSQQDFDLLKSVSDQAAACLLNIQLSQKLVQAKQFEAFQAMSAFFVHDLKNTASTLSLMLQNLPIHYQDPQFREDALRGVSKTVQHINELIARLGALRQNLELTTSECDLNELVVQTLDREAGAPGIQIVKRLQLSDRVCLDPLQIQKVLTNLVINARESFSGNGTITVETNQRDTWAMLTVSDTGCGMSPEFIDRSLFRPFITTKKKGMGIGMFHCKMIVNAHHGRIEVDSQVGKGTVFRVFLPLEVISKHLDSVSVKTGAF